MTPYASPPCVSCGAVPACEESQGRPACAQERAATRAALCFALLALLVGAAVVVAKVGGS